MSKRDQVFISYSHKDKVWLARLKEMLTPSVREGLKNWEDTRIDPGAEWREEIQQALSSAKVALLLVSPAFLNSDFIHKSELPPLLETAKKGGLTILWVLLSACQYKKSPIEKYQALHDLSKPLDKLEEESPADLNALLVTICEKIENALKNSTDLTAGAENDGKIFHIPMERNSFFTGREKVLEEIRDTLNEHRRHAISGMGGLGKTQIAIEYAYRHREKYEAIFWVSANSSISLVSGFTEIAHKLKLISTEERDSQAIVNAVKRWLGEHQDWLLIFDNADQPQLVKECLPLDPQGHILLTSRASVFDALAIVKPLELKEMLDDEAVQFLFKRTGRSQDMTGEAATAATLAQELGYLPLALEQAGAYIIQNKASFANYLTSYEKNRVKLLKKSKAVTGNYPESVATTWAMNFEEVEKESKASRDLLKASAFLAADNIPFELITQGADKLGAELEAALQGIEEDPLLLSEKVLKPLLSYSLIRVNSVDEMYSLHRLVQEVVQYNMGLDEQRKWAERIIHSLRQVFPVGDYKNWTACERFIVHAKKGAELVDKYQFEFVEAAILLGLSAYYLHKKAEYEAAEPLYQRALGINEKVLGPDHPNTKTILGNYHAVLIARGKSAEAANLLKRFQ